MPLHEQILNEAEKNCLVTWDDAAALMIRADGISSRLFNEAVSHSPYVELCMSTTASSSRGFKTPLEIIRGTVPDISKLFYRGYHPLDSSVCTVGARPIALPGLTMQVKTSLVHRKTRRSIVTNK